MNIKKKRESLTYKLKKKDEPGELTEEQKLNYLKEIFYFYSK